MVALGRAHILGFPELGVSSVEPHLGDLGDLGDLGGGGRYRWNRAGEPLRLVDADVDETVPGEKVECLGMTTSSGPTSMA
jgi:hypothetical protein